MEKRYKKIIIASIVSFFAVPIIGTITYWDIHHAMTKRTLTSGAQIGWSEQKVIEHLGSPKATVTSLDDPVLHGGGFLPAPNRKVSNKLLVFQLNFWRIYVYIDKDNKVEFTQLSRT